MSKLLFKHGDKPLICLVFRMRIFPILILMISLLSFFPASTYSQITKLTLNMKNSSLLSVLKTIESKSDYKFFFNDKIDVKKIVSIDVKQKSIPEILDLLFVNTSIKYKILGLQIALYDKTEMEPVLKEPQRKKISGKVTDTSGALLPGVSVLIKSTKIGVVTDIYGFFSLDNVPENAILQFSFIGLKTLEEKIAGRKDINVSMEDGSIVLDEVVAIGYGTARKRDLIGSVSSINGKSLRDIPVSSAAEAIVGRLAGVQVTKTEGSPDAEMKIRIRGGGSLTQDNSPLYIVDGFPVTTINDIAPTDIATIDVLKDASSTAIYGARGANGVILITTKGGYEGKAKVSYNMYYGLKQITKTLDVLNPYEYVLYQRELTQDLYFDRYFGAGVDMDLYKHMAGTNWQNEVFGRTGNSMYHNLSVTGGSKISKYNISLTQNDDKEIMLGNATSRTNFSAKTTNKINEWLTLDLNTRLSDANIDGAGTSANGRLADAIQYRPINGLMEYVDYSLTATDYEAASQYVLNPVKQTNDDYRRSKSLTFNFNAAATIQFTKDLNYRFEYGTQYGDITNNRFFGINTWNVFNYAGQPLASIQKTSVKSYRLANMLNYIKRDFFPGSNVNVMLGEELNSYKTFDVISSSKYFPKYIDAVSALSMMNLGTPDPTQTADNPETKTSSFFGRVMYDYKGKYLLNATLRADGSSKFAPGYQWGYFPSVGLAWRISDENFLKTAKDKWLSDLKLRASFGESGNNRISDNAWQKVFYVKTDTWYANGNETSPTTLLTPIPTLSNPKLKWETTITRNIGLDYSFFNQRLSGSVEVYQNTTNDLLISATVPSSTGYTNQWQNIGQTSNKGVEFVLNGVLIEKKDFRLSASFNIAFNQNHIDKLGDTKQWEQSSNWTGAGGPTGDYLIKEGGSIGQMYGYVTDGMYSFDDFTYANGTYTIKPGVPDDHTLIGPLTNRFEPGMLKLKDQNGDGIVDTKDKVVIGNANPIHTGGFNLTAQFKGFDLSAFFNWVYGNSIYNANKLQFSSELASRTFRNILNTFNSDNRFTYINQETGKIVSDPVQLYEMNKNATIWSADMMSAPLHSWAVEDGSFLRFNNLTIGYSLPKSVLKALKLSQLRFYGTLYNIITWTNYTGYDPEVDTQRSTPLTPGVDYSAYPRSRSFNLGLNLEF